jgi:SAM-dependent methyltransferase
MTMSSLPLTRCPACRSSNARTISLGAATLNQCVNCHLPYAPWYVDPSEIYKEGYHSGGCGNFGVDISHPEWRSFLEFVGERRVDILERVVTSPGRMLDVGCGTGQTLAAASRRGWDAVGVDLVPSAVQIAVEDYGLDVRMSTLEDSGLPPRSFDVVATTHVLEHQQDGMAFLSSIGQWVKPGGHLFIEVPNWKSLDRIGNKDTWYGLRPLEHMAHYSPRTLAATLERVGFKPVAVRTPFYQFPDQSLSQALHDFGLDPLSPRMNRDALTVRGTQRDQTVRLPNAFMWRVLHGLAGVAATARLGVVVVMTARVP